MRSMDQLFYALYWSILNFFSSASYFIVLFPCLDNDFRLWKLTCHSSIDLAGAYLNTIKRTVKYLCPADIIPPYIDVDLSELDVGQKLLMRDLKVHPAVRLLQSPDQPVCNIIGSRVRESKKSKWASQIFEWTKWPTHWIRGILCLLQNMSAEDSFSFKDCMTCLVFPNNCSIITVDKTGMYPNSYISLLHLLQLPNLVIFRFCIWIGI